MNGIASDYGAEISELLAHLNTITVPAHANTDWVKIRNLQKRLDAKGASLLIEHRHRARLVADRAWAETDVHGFERALVLVGGANDDTGAARLERRLHATTARVTELSGEIDAVDRRIADIEAEIVSTQQILVNVLRHTIDDAEEKIRAAKRARLRRKAMFRATASLVDETPMWSPTAVMGYRAGILNRDGLYGAWHRWKTPRLVAVCEMGSDVPHTDGRCAEVGYGCGVYAAKDVTALMDEVGVGVKGRYAVGLVGLEGKVIEHERGYRAERATVLALAIADRHTLRFVDGPRELAATFATQPTTSLASSNTSLTVADTPSMWAAISTYLEDQTQRRTLWTSANPNG